MADQDPNGVRIPAIDLFGRSNFAGEFGICLAQAQGDLHPKKAGIPIALIHSEVRKVAGFT
jgi:hypothetical protein